MMDPGNIDDGGDDKVEYHCDEEWYSPDIYLTTSITKDTFNKTSQSSKEELDFKNIMKECDNLLARKNNVLTL